MFARRALWHTQQVVVGLTTQQAVVISVALAKTAVRKNRPLMRYEPKKQKVSVWHRMTIADLAISAEVDEKKVVDLARRRHFVKNKSPDAELSAEQANALVQALGYAPKVVAATVARSEEHTVADAVRAPPPDPSICIPRPPIVTIMGHVDHGKTTLLDTLRHSDVAKHEHGGITQHIGAFSSAFGYYLKIVKDLSAVDVPSTSSAYNRITFIDTPGHAAFATMRQRGATCTDIVVLVVAADDGVQEQTIESIRYARNANVPIIVAINKIDKQRADVLSTRRMLLDAGIELESEGGDVQAVEISALKGTNLDNLLDAIITQAEMMELKGDAKGNVEGVILDASMRQGFGVVATVLVQRGTLKRGDVLVAGGAYCRARLFSDNHPFKECTLSHAIELSGWRDGQPAAGDVVIKVESEQVARAIATQRRQRAIAERSSEQAQQNEALRQQLAEEARERRDNARKRGLWKSVYLRREREEARKTEYRAVQWYDENAPRYSLIVKADVLGSLEAIQDALATYDCSEQCVLEVVDAEIGAPTEEDIENACQFGAAIYMFNIEPTQKLKEQCREANVPLLHYNVIYHLIDGLKEQINAVLPLVSAEFVLGRGTVVAVFSLNMGRNKEMPVAGTRVQDGAFRIGNVRYRVMRGTGGQRRVIYDGPMASMRHEKESIVEAHQGQDVGLLITNRYDSEHASVKYEIGDTIECYEIRQVPQTTKWSPKGF